MSQIYQKKSLSTKYLKENITSSFLPQPPILSSVKAGWDNLFLEYHYQPSGEHSEIVPSGHGIVVFTNVEKENYVERIVDEKHYQYSVKTGDILLIPANVGVTGNWQGYTEFIMLGFDPNFFRQTVDESEGKQSIELIPQIDISDLLILQMGLALKKILENYNNSSHLYLDTMTNALAVHLMQHYGIKKPLEKQYSSGLSRKQLKEITDYINANLNQDLRLSELASLVRISDHYFITLFKESTGLTPHKYVINQRITRAKELLSQEKMTIAEIAHTVGFANQSHLNFHFKRIVGITPKKFSKNL